LLAERRAELSTNPYLKYYGHSGEQELLEDLVIESIASTGIDMLYLTQENVANSDPLFLENPGAHYSSAIEIEMYLKSFEGFQGDGNFMSNLGVEIRDQVVFTVAVRRFNEEIGVPKNLPRPREGDLLLYKFNNKLFEIKYVNKHPVHYPLGALQMYDLTCELLELSGQRFDTGIPEIDRLTGMLTEDILMSAITTANGAPLMTSVANNYIVQSSYKSDIDPLDNADDLQREADSLYDFTSLDPFSEGRY
jgi:hypothetical protein